MVKEGKELNIPLFQDQVMVHQRFMRSPLAFVVIACLVVSTAHGIPMPIHSESTTGLSSSQINQRAIQLAQKGFVQEAIPLFERALELEPTNAEYWNNAGVTLMRLKLYHSVSAA